MRLLGSLDGVRRGGMTGILDLFLVSKEVLLGLTIGENSCGFIKLRKFLPTPKFLKWFALFGGDWLFFSHEWMLSLSKAFSCQLWGSPSHYLKPSSPPLSLLFPGSSCHTPVLPGELGALCL